MPRLELKQAQAPLVFGVTGHRDLREEDLDQLKQRVKDVFAKFHDDYQSTPFVMLSPLAEGADRLVARIALSAGARLIVPLPMPQQLYEEDFTEPGSLDEFRTLLAQADLVFEVPLSNEGLTGEAAISEQGSTRSRHYQEVGIYIVAHCQILIALWDGASPGKTGGTAEIVEFQREGLPPRGDCDLQPPELFPVYHILTPRRSNPNPAGTLFHLDVLYPRRFTTKEAKEYYAKVFRNVDEFNRDVAGLGDSLEIKMASSRKLIFNTGAPAQLSGDELQTLDRYAVADVLAMQYSRYVGWLHRALHLLVFAAFAGFVLFAHVEGHPLVALKVALALFVVARVSYAVAKIKGITYKHEDYRALAEGCRVRLFWQIAGVNGSVPNFYLGRQRTELDWIRNVLRGWEIGVKPPPHKVWAIQDRLKTVVDHWVQGQVGFYLPEKSEQREKKSERMEILVLVCLSSAIALGFLLFIALQGAHGERWEWETEWTEWIVIAIDLFLAAGALLHHARHRTAHSEHAKLYRRMHVIFIKGCSLVEAKLTAQDYSSAQACLRSLGKEALAENGEWVLLHRERALEMPHP
jgi:hypothetical protein